MEKTLILFKLCYKFSKKYMAGYISAIAKPIFAAILGILFLATIYIDTKFLPCSLLSIPLLCWAFWKGYVITYGLIPCAYNFIKEPQELFKKYSLAAKQNEGKIAKYICFVAILSLFLYFPAVIYFTKISPFSLGLIFDTVQQTSYIKHINNVFLINTLLLAPFSNYALCALYFKKEKENYINLFLNCYKHLDITGFMISLMLTFFSFQGGVIYLIIGVFLNPFIYSINTFWYMTRVKNIFS